MTNSTEFTSYELDRLIGEQVNSIELPIGIFKGSLHFSIGNSGGLHILFKNKENQICLKSASSYPHVIGNKYLSKTDVSLKHLKQTIETYHHTENYHDNSLLEEIKTYLKDHYYSSREEDYTLLACYIILTYIYPIFERVPFLHIWGDKGTGKSQLCSALASLCFNSITGGCGTTIAAIRRNLDNSRGTLILDDFEIFNNQSEETQAFRGQLNSAYKTDHPEIICIGKENKPTSLRIGGPKIFNSINEFEPVLQSRTIIIETSKPPSNFRVSNKHSINYELLKSRLVVFALVQHAKIRTYFECFDKALTRESDLLYPLLSIAKLFDGYTGKGTLQEQVKKKMEGSEDIKKAERLSFDDYVTKALHEIWEEKGRTTDFNVTNDCLSNSVHTFDSILIPKSIRETKNRVMSSLRRKGLLINAKRERLSGIENHYGSSSIRCTVYQINVEQLKFITKDL